MRSSSVHQSVARATGEPVRLIRRMGFTLIVPPPPDPRTTRLRASSPDRSTGSRSTARPA